MELVQIRQIFSSIAVLLVALVQPSAAQDRGSDVKGGFFSREEINSAIVSGNPPAVPQATPATRRLDLPQRVAPTVMPTAAKTEWEAQPGVQTKPIEAPSIPKSGVRRENVPSGNAFAPRRTPSPFKVNSAPTPTPTPSDEDVARDPAKFMEHLRSITGAARDAQPAQRGFDPRGEYIMGKSGLRAPSGGEPTPTPTPHATPPPTGAADLSRLFQAPSAERLQNISISLIVNALPKSHLDLAVRRLSKLHRQLKIPVRYFLVIGRNPDLRQVGVDVNVAEREMKIALSGRKDLNPESVEAVTKEFDRLVPDSAKALTELKLNDGPAVNADQVIAKYGITTSPAWIVHSNGVDHLFEGDYDPSEFFDGEGAFIPEQ